MKRTTRHEGEDRASARPGPAGSFWRHPVAIAGTVVLGIIVVYQGLTSWPGTRTPAPVDIKTMADGVPPSERTSAQASKGRKGSTVVVEPDEEGPMASLAPDLEFDDGQEGDWDAEPNLPARHEDPLLSDPTHAVELIRELAHVKPQGEKFTATEIEQINRMIRELKQMGEAALPAIRDFLESKADVRLADLSVDTASDHTSLRIALLDALVQIPGRDALDLMAQTVQTTTGPEEIAVLAQGIEQRTPGTHRGEIVGAARRVLGTALQSDPQTVPDLGHLFGVLQDYADANVASDLAAVVAQKSPWSDYALMALPKLAEGRGVPYLVAIAEELSDGQGQARHHYPIALRMLAQASRAYPEAGDAILELAQRSKIDSYLLVTMASTLGGTEYQLITKSSELPAGMRSKSLVHSKGAAPETWSDDELDGRLALIDRLLTINSDPAAVSALQQAQQRLREWKSRFMVNGKRLRS